MSTAMMVNSEIRNCHNEFTQSPIDCVPMQQRSRKLCTAYAAEISCAQSMAREDWTKGREMR